MTQPTILLADDDKDFLNLLTRRCESLGFEVVAVEDALTALSTADFFPPTLACFDVNMPSGNGLAACEMMKDDQRLSAVPVIILTGKKDEQTIRRCHELGAYYIVKSSTVWDDLRSLIAELVDVEPPQDPLGATVGLSNRVGTAGQAGSGTRESEDDGDPGDHFLAACHAHASVGMPPPRRTGGLVPVAPVQAGELIDRFLLEVGSESEGDAGCWPSKPWVLCVDDDADFAHSLKLRLEAEGIGVLNAFEGMEGYRRAFTHPAHAVLLDYQMPGGQGDYCLRRLKENPLTKHIPVIVLTGNKNRTIERQMLNLGARCVLHKPIEFAQLSKQLRRLMGSRQTLGEPVPVS